MAQLKALIKKTLIFVGIRPPTKIPSIKDFRHWSEIPAIELKKNSLDAIVDRVRLKKDHNYYNLILKTYIPSFEDSFKSTGFIGYGVGKENLNCYRKVVFLESNEELFEKVYFTDNDKLKSLLWFDENTSLRQAQELIIPKVKKVLHGDFLTAVYFEYVNLLPLNLELLNSSLNKIAIVLYNNSLGFENTDKTPTFFKEYQSHNYYKNNIDKTIQKFGKKIDFCKLNKSIANSFFVISHGDLSETNVCQDNVVIDWDSCGYFPLGLDIAKIYFRLIVNNEYDTNFEGWLINNYQAHIKEEHWLDLYRNFSYFLLIFIQDPSLKATSKLQELEAKLLVKVSQQGTI